MVASATSCDTECRVSIVTIDGISPGVHLAWRWLVVTPGLHELAVSYYARSPNFAYTGYVTTQSTKARYITCTLEAGKRYLVKPGGPGARVTELGDWGPYCEATLCTSVLPPGLCP